LPTHLTLPSPPKGKREIACKFHELIRLVGIPKFKRIPTAGLIAKILPDTTARWWIGAAYPGILNGVFFRELYI
jgi:hypothetical protein